MISKAYFYFHPSTDPYKTLAFEEYMVEHIKKGEIMLLLYTHESSVIIGKNQNAWLECRHELLKEEGGKLARRISGGGAVYHDLKNLNFSFIVDKEEYDLEKQLSVIVDAISSFGLNAGFSGRNDILIDGKKFSGNAFCFKQTGAFHHGTLLIGADKDKMARYLSVSKDKIASKGIDSVRSRTCNLQDFNPEITNLKVADALKNSFEKIYMKTEDFIVSEEIEKETEKISEKNATWDWILGYSPDFDISIKERFPWGGVEICLNTKDGIITESKIYSDAMDTSFIDLIESSLVSVRFSSSEICRKIRSLDFSYDRQGFVSDICKVIEERKY